MAKRSTAKAEPLDALDAWARTAPRAYSKGGCVICRNKKWSAEVAKFKERRDAGVYKQSVNTFVAEYMRSRLGYDRSLSLVLNHMRGECRP